jgi:O-antigen ligase/tetratricopeptide (TPR) repeat protein
MKRHYFAAGFAGVSIFSSALWCGTLADRSQVIPGGGNMLQLYGLPIAAVLSACGLVVAWWNGDKKSTVSAAAILSFLIASTCLLSLPRSHDLSTSLNVLLILATALACGAAVKFAAGDASARWGLVICLLASGAVVAGMGLSEYALHAREGDTSWRVFSTFAMPNFLAGFLVMHLPIAAALFLAARDRLVTHFSGFVLMLEAACLLLTGSRFGLLGGAAAFISFLVLALASGAFLGETRKRTLGLLGICVVAALIGARPILARIAGAGGESYSSRFRTMTWRGTLDMAVHNPLLGTGIGTFPTAYAPYAKVGYTEHAHNSYLQLAAEIGFAGAALAALALFGVVVIGIQSIRRMKSGPDPEIRDAPFNSTIVIAGLVAALIGGCVRNLFDSDLYVAVNTITLTAVCGVILAQARNPLGLRLAIPGGLVKFGSVALAACMVLQSGRLAAGRLDAYAAQEALQAGNANEALSEFKNAVSSDPGNSDYRLNVADVLARTGDVTGAEAEYRHAVTAADVGKTHYRYAKYLLETGRFKDAVLQFQEAERRDPHYLPNLLLMADALRADQRPREAVGVYARIVALHRSPVGELRALPEQIPWEFAMAYLGLAEDMIAVGKPEQAESDMKDGAHILGEFWRLRNDTRNHVRPDVWDKVTRKYDWALEQLEKAARARGEARKEFDWAIMRTKYLSELEEENKKRQVGRGE